MKKLILLLIILYHLIYCVEKTKEEKVAKYIIRKYTKRLCSLLQFL